MITPTLKVKRNRIEESFGQYFEIWTSVGKPVVWHEQ
jgi:long-chain acyl-CoA synthetase